MKSFRMTSEFLQPLHVMVQKLLLQPRAESHEVLSIMSETARLVYFFKINYKTAHLSARTLMVQMDNDLRSAAKQGQLLVPGLWPVSDTSWGWMWPPSKC